MLNFARAPENVQEVLRLLFLTDEEYKRFLENVLTQPELRLILQRRRDVVIEMYSEVFEGTLPWATQRNLGLVECIDRHGHSPEFQRFHAEVVMRVGGSYAPTLSALDDILLTSERPDFSLENTDQDKVRMWAQLLSGCRPGSVLEEVGIDFIERTSLARDMESERIAREIREATNLRLILEEFRRDQE